MKLIKKIDFTKMQSLDRSLFNVAVGDKWHNKELQKYVDDENHLYFDEEGMHIKATYSEEEGYKSTRLNTKDKFMFQYGKIDIVAKVPKGRGTWPALWMLSSDNRYGGWPRSGEIDIMEHTGNHLDELFLALHCEAYNHTKDSEYLTKIQVDGLSDDYQKFSLLWREDSIEYFLNDQPIVKYEKGENGKETSHKGWPFEHPYYLLINLAVGGTFGGKAVKEDFPQVFSVKSIHIYQ